MGGFDNMFSGLGVSASGLVAERIRMDVAAQNIANAQTTGGPNGVYRRREVLFETALAKAVRGGKFRPAGTRVREVTEDPSPFQRVYDPRHPEADAQGWRTLPNVNVPLELVDLITAARAYEANVMAGRTYREMAQRALTILR